MSDRPEAAARNFSLRIHAYVIAFYRRLGSEQGRGYQGIMRSVLTQFADNEIAKRGPDAD